MREHRSSRPSLVPTLLCLLLLALAGLGIWKVHRVNEDRALKATNESLVDLRLEALNAKRLAEAPVQHEAAAGHADDAEPASSQTPSPSLPPHD